MGDGSFTLNQKHDEIPIISAKPVKMPRKSRSQSNLTLSKADKQRTM
jgi:hypothetical protein